MPCHVAPYAEDSFVFGKQTCCWLYAIHLCLRIESRHTMATKCRRKSRTPVETIDPVILASVAICEFARLFLLLLCCKPVLSVTVSTVIELFFVSKSGEMSCEPLDQPCPTPQCNHPARRKGECCPTCDGWVFVLLSSPIENERSVTLTRQGPIYVCVCVFEVCEYDRRLYTDGETFSPEGSGPCLQCRCKVQ